MRGTGWTEKTNRMNARGEKEEEKEDDVDEEGGRTGGTYAGLLPKNSFHLLAGLSLSKRTGLVQDAAVSRKPLGR